MSYSQLGQDKWVLEHIPHPGYFVDIGASDGILMSNTYGLERLGWMGICVEPNSRFFRGLKKNRNCHISNCCVLNKTDLEVDFCEATNGFYSGVTSYFLDHLKRKGRVVKKQTISLNDLLAKFDAPKQIDYLSMDTENSEWAILEAFDFSYKFRCITIEHNGIKENQENIAALLKKHHYKKAKEIAGIEDWYLYEFTLL